jgi:hypothetical protein
MASIYTKVKLYLEANSKTFENERDNLLLQNNSDGAGDFIASWNVSGLAQPTAEQLATYDSSGDTAEANRTVDSTRKASYGDWRSQLDEIYHDIDSWKSRIKSIKDANQKS